MKPEEMDEFLQQAEGLAYAFNVLVDQVMNLANAPASREARLELAAQAVARMFAMRLGNDFKAAEVLAELAKNLRRHAMQSGAGQ